LKKKGRETCGQAHDEGKTRKDLVLQRTSRSKKEKKTQNFRKRRNTRKGNRRQEESEG